MRSPALLLLLAVAACGEADRTPEPVANAIRPPAKASNRLEPEPPAAPARPEAPAQPPGDYPGVAEMSPSQRRAYDRGYRDCRAGRYDAPDSWAEAYRIGCAAAQEAG